MQITDAGTDEQIRMAARGPIAFYVGRMGTYYYEMLERHGFEAEVAKIKEGWAARDPKAAAAGVSDRMLDQTAIVGPIEKLRRGDERAPRPGRGSAADPACPGAMRPRWGRSSRSCSPKHRRAEPRPAPPGLM